MPSTTQNPAAKARFLSPQQAAVARAAARRMQTAAVFSLLAAGLALLATAAWAITGSGAGLVAAGAGAALLLGALGATLRQGGAAGAAALEGGDAARAQLLRALSRVRLALILKALLVFPTAYLIITALQGA